MKVCGSVAHTHLDALLLSVRIVEQERWVGLVMEPLEVPGGTAGGAA